MEDLDRRSSFDGVFTGVMLQKILHNTEILMGLVEDLNAEIVKLRQLVSDDNTNDAAAVIALKDRIAVLEAQIASGVATPEQIQAAIDSLKEIESLITPA